MNALARSFALLALSAPALAGAGDTLWQLEIPGTPTLHRPSVAPDGTVYWAVSSLYALSPSGQLLWQRPQSESGPVAIAADGTLYIGGVQPPPSSHLAALKAFAPNGDHLWDFTGFGAVVGFLGGPAVGPDGNVYAVTSGGLQPSPNGFGAFSLTPTGSLRWHVDGFSNDSGAPDSELVFGDGHMYKAEYWAPMPAGQFQSGLLAFELDGDYAWRYSTPTEADGAERHPVVSPLNGNVHLVRKPRNLATFTPSGAFAWEYGGPWTPTGFGAPVVGPDGSVYVVNGNLHVISVDADGSERWTANDVLSTSAMTPEVSPDGALLVIATQSCSGGACSGRLLGLATADGAVVFDLPLPDLGGQRTSAGTQPRFSHDSAVVYLGVRTVETLDSSFLLAIDISTGGGCGSIASYCQTAPNSNGSGAIIDATGSTSVSANDLVLTVDGAAIGRPGLFYYGASQTQLPFGDGFRCVNGATFRLPIVQTDATGDASYALDLAGSSGAGQISSGDTWHFQFWFRDPLAGGATFNLSDALSATFCD